MASPPAAMKKGFADILGAMEEQSRRKALGKLKGWDVPDVILPGSLALEQCSSTEAAEYKASLALRFCGAAPDVIVDITGGLGSDSFAFARVAGKVIYIERQQALVDAAVHNAALFGLGNMDFHCTEVSPESVAALPRCTMLYADPARRDSAGRKVFALEDCTPDILKLLPGIFVLTDKVMLKISPMADISRIAEQLGQSLKELHIVSLRGEVKELLCLLEDGGSEGFEVTVVEPGSGEFSFSPSEERSAEAVYASSVEPGMLLVEPSAAVLKSGAFKLISNRFGLHKLDVSTHLYLSQAAPELPPGLFKTFTVTEVLPFGKAGMRELGKRWPDAEVTARNIPVTSEELRRRMGCRGGGRTHIFACSTAASGRVLIAAEKV